MKLKPTINLIKEQGLEAFLDFASIGIVIVGRDLNIILVNKFACNLFSYLEEELIGSSINLLIPVRFLEKHKGHNATYMANPQSRPMGLGLDLYAKRKDGSEFPVEISLGTYKIQEEIYIISFINDISIRKQNENSIKTLNAQLEQKVHERTMALGEAISKLQLQIKETEEAESELEKALAAERHLGELKSRFVTLASHEFRTPLSTINSSAYLLQKYITSDDQLKRDKHIDRIISSVNSLISILDDFLSVGKIEEGKVITKLVPSDISVLIDTSINQITPILKKGQVVQYVQNGPSILDLDPTLMRHILLNLLSNAIKFSPEDQPIIVNVNSERRPWNLSIRDSGIGIPNEDQGNLFERFFRASNAANIQGTGLGLHIVSKYVQYMNGTIACRSQLGVGTTFELSFS